MYSNKSKQIYIQDLEFKQLFSIQVMIQNGPMSIFIDATTDIKETFIENVIIEKLCEEFGNLIFINCEKLKQIIKQ